jgi:hypothetical protein
MVELADTVTLYPLVQVPETVWPPQVPLTEKPLYVPAAIDEFQVNVPFDEVRFDEVVPFNV